MRRNYYRVAIAALLSSPLPAHGQIVAGAEVISGVGRPLGGAWVRESRVSPSVRAVTQAGYLNIEGVLGEHAGSFVAQRLTVDGGLQSPAFGVFRMSTWGRVARDADRGRVLTDAASIGGALSARLGAAGVWLGAAHDESRAPEAPRGARFLVGAWRSLGSAIVSITSTRQTTHVPFNELRAREITFRDSVVTDTGVFFFPGRRTISEYVNGTRLRRLSDVEARVDWSGGRLALTGSVSGMPRADSARGGRIWGRLVGTFQVSPRMSFVASAGALPRERMLAARNNSARFATFGVRLSPAALFRSPLPPAVRAAPSAFRVVPATSGEYRVAVRVARARTVEISGDFNQWTPISLRETTPDLWEVTLPLAAGTHRVNVRIDGDAWTAPPGLPMIDDEFNGRVGIMVVR